MLTRQSGGVTVVALPVTNSAIQSKVLVLRPDAAGALAKQCELVVPGSVEAALAAARAKPAELLKGGLPVAAAEDDDADGGGDEEKGDAGDAGGKGPKASSPALVVDAAVTPDGSCLLVATNGRLLLGFETATGALLSLAVLARAPTALALTPNGKHVLVADSLGDVYALSVRALCAGEVSPADTAYSPQSDEAFFSSRHALAHGCVVTAMRFVPCPRRPGAFLLVSTDQESKIRVSSFPDVFSIHGFCHGQPSSVSALDAFPAPLPAVASSEAAPTLLLTASGLPLPPADDGEAAMSEAATGCRLVLWEPASGEALDKITLRHPAGASFLPPSATPAHASTVAAGPGQTGPFAVSVSWIEALAVAAPAAPGQPPLALRAPAAAECAWQDTSRFARHGFVMRRAKLRELQFAAVTATPGAAAVSGAAEGKVGGGDGKGKAGIEASLALPASALRAADPGSAEQAALLEEEVVSVAAVGPALFLALTASGALAQVAVAQSAPTDAPLVANVSVTLPAPAGAAQAAVGSVGRPEGLALGPVATLHVRTVETRFKSERWRSRNNEQKARNAAKAAADAEIRKKSLKRGREEPAAGKEGEADEEDDVEEDGDD